MYAGAPYIKMIHRIHYGSEKGFPPLTFEASHSAVLIISAFPDKCPCGLKQHIGGGIGIEWVLDGGISHLFITLNAAGFIEDFRIDNRSLPLEELPVAFPEIAKLRCFNLARRLIGERVDQAIDAAITASTR